jgi:hypothetical protein
LSSVEIAAWVQAIGSIVAVVAAFVISTKQFQSALSLQQSAVRVERHRRFEALNGLIEAALEEFALAVKALRGPAPTEWFAQNSTQEIMEECYQAFTQISPLDMPSAATARALVTLRDRLKTAAWNANAALENGTSNYKEYMDCVEAMEDNLNDVRTEQQKLLADFART